MNPATENAPAPDLYFGPFTLSRRQCRLTRTGPNGPEAIALTPKAFEVLAALAARPGEVIEKADLMRQVWGETFVDETTLSQNIFTIRKALGDSAYIETVPRRGFRFVAPAASETAPEVTAVTPRAHSSHSTWLWPVLAGLLLIAGLGYWKLRPTPAAQPPIQSLVVLPFANLSGDTGQEYFADGLTEEIINALAPVPGLRVVARTSAFQFKGKGADIRDIGSKLGVDAVLEGSIRIQGDQLRVTAQLNDARNGFHYWSRSWDHGMKDVFAVQMEVAREVLTALNGPAKSLPRLVKPLTENLEAYDHYLRGNALLRQIQSGKLKEVEAAFNAALKLDPNFAAAEAGIASAYSLILQWGLISPELGLARQRAHVQRALELDPNLSVAHSLRAQVSFFGDWDWPAAERSFRRAIELNPSDADAHHNYAHYLVAMGRFDEALAEANLTVAINPVDVFALQHFSWHYLLAGDAPRAIAGAQRALAIDPHGVVALTYLRNAYALAGNYQGVIESEERLGVAPPDLDRMRAAVKTSGATGYWNARYELDVKRGREEAFLALDLAEAGRAEEALDLLERAVAKRQALMPYLKYAPSFISMHNNPRFQGLVRKVGLPE